MLLFLLKILKSKYLESKYYTFKFSIFLANVRFFFSNKAPSIVTLGSFHHNGLQKLILKCPYK